MDKIIGVRATALAEAVGQVYLGYLYQRVIDGIRAAEIRTGGLTHTIVLTCIRTLVPRLVKGLQGAIYRRGCFWEGTARRPGELCGLSRRRRGSDTLAGGGPSFPGGSQGLTPAVSRWKR